MASAAIGAGRASASPGVVHTQFGIAELRPWLVLAAYGALTSVGIAHHEPWADEAQAWQLARSLPLRTLFAHALRYEGSPGLWHLLLHSLAVLHLGYAGMHWVTGLIALWGVALLVFRAPFPSWARFTLPFTFFLAYQFPVVARSYVLAPLLLFSLAITWKRKSAVGPAILLGLLANVAMHCYAISLGFALVYAWEIWRKERTVKHLWFSVGILFVFYAAALLTVLPQPADLYSPAVQTPGASIWSAILLRLMRCSSYVTYGTALPAPVGCLLLGMFVPSLWGPHLRYFLPVLTLAAFSGFCYFNFWHLGLLVLT
jgi:hypothetical protein